MPLVKFTQSLTYHKIEEAGGDNQANYNENEDLVPVEARPTFLCRNNGLGHVDHSQGGRGVHKGHSTRGSVPTSDGSILGSTATSGTVE